MKFSEQYKDEINNITLSDEQYERIHAGVYEKLSRATQKKKKPLPLRIIAISGASAACVLLAAVVTLRLSTSKLEGNNFAAADKDEMPMSPTLNIYDTENSFDSVGNTNFAADNAGFGRPELTESPEGGKYSDIKEIISKPQFEPPTSDSLSVGSPEPDNAVQPQIAEIVFTDDGAQCIVTTNRAEQRFEHLSDHLNDHLNDFGDPSAAIDGYVKLLALSDKGDEYTIVYFDENNICVFDNNMQIVGFYKKLL